MKEKIILHLVTQDNQPYGSRRKCCQKCGLAIAAFSSNDRYVEYPSEWKNGKGTRICSPRRKQ
ncbi:MAG: hypothetical protein EHM49_02340 [Deltaproteobacteria bacterium]|nr:MAG: hypothetical protein EHM49_02340 [Deltaproteobacteria bacterium]